MDSHLSWIIWGFLPWTEVLIGRSLMSDPWFYDICSIFSGHEWFSTYGNFPLSLSLISWLFPSLTRWQGILTPKAGSLEIIRGTIFANLIDFSSCGRKIRMGSKYPTFSIPLLATEGYFKLPSLSSTQATDSSNEDT